MPAYVIVNVEVSDTAEYEVYKQMAPGSIEAYGGRYLVRGGPVDVFEGRWSPRRVVVLEFPTKRKAHEWWNSTEYADAKAKRQSCAYTELVVVEGVVG